MDENYNKGVTAYKEGNFHLAAEFFKKAIDLEDQNSKYWSSLGITYYRIGLFDQAIICFDKALLLNPNNLQYSLNRDKCLDKINYQKNAKNSVVYKRNLFLLSSGFLIPFFIYINSTFLMIGIIISSIILYFDAKTLKAGVNSGNELFESLTPNVWLIFSLILWPIAISIYILKRRKIFIQNNNLKSLYKNDENIKSYKNEILQYSRYFFVSYGAVA